LASRKGANAVNLLKTRVVIVGAGQEGRGAEALRAAGHVAASPSTTWPFRAVSPPPEKRFTGPTLKTLILN